MLLRANHGHRGNEARSREITKFKFVSMADLLATVQHDINCLSDENRATRKRAVQQLSEFFNRLSVQSKTDVEAVQLFH